MGRIWAKLCEVTPDVKIGYSSKMRKGRPWLVVFFEGEKRIEKGTRHEVRSKKPPAEFWDEAEEIVREYFRPAALFPTAKVKTWDEALEEVIATSPTTRAETIRSFRAGIKAVKEVLPDVKTPSALTEDHVRRFSKLWLSKPNKQTGGPRSPVTLSYYLRALSSFANHLKALGYVKANPWKGASVPKPPKRDKKPSPTEAEVNAFFSWVHERYPNWKALHALLNLKNISASRTADVCQVKTAQLRGGRLTFTADITKTNEDRGLPLPKSLFEALKEVAGPVWVWEGLFAEIRQYRKASNGYPSSFSWKTVYAVVNNIFREYNEGPNAGKTRFTPHGLRRRGITAAVKATGSIDAGAHAIGVTSQTAAKHYLDAKQAFETDEVMTKLGEALLFDPKKNRGAIGGQKGTSSKKTLNKQG